MRSKFDQKLFIGATPNASARPMTTANTRSAKLIAERRGLYTGSIDASTSQAAKMISTMILKAKAFVLMNGKKSEPETKKTVNGSISKPPSIV